MDALQVIQQLQLRLVESAAINESCANDLMSILRRLTDAEASCIIEIIALLDGEAAFLRKLSKEINCCPDAYFPGGYRKGV
ncbi:hypothetical protein ACIQSO_11550 [Pseudomonas putida]|uniref:hypothetical protein n=1 Tax=Pseudomonas putida TaxID=303 RepID=UPI00383B021E